MLSNRTVGFLGAGNMAEAIIRGLLKSELVHPENIVASRRNEAALDRLANELGVKTTTDNRALIAASDIVFLCVKPQMMMDLLAEIGGFFRPEQTVMSVAAGLTTASLEGTITPGVPVIRVMPNTPALVGEGVSGFCLGTHATPAHAREASELLATTGVATEITEEVMNGLTAISGSGPAYIFYIMEALFEGAKKVGLTQSQADMLIAQTILGAARLAQETAVEPAELRRRVTSPGGTTEAAIRSLQESGVGEAIVSAVVAARDRGIELGRQHPVPPSDDVSEGRP